MSGEEATCQSPVRSPLKDDSSDVVAVQKSECGEGVTRSSPVRSPLKDDSSDVVAVQKSECDTSQQDNEVQEENNSMEDIEAADSFLTVDITGDTSIEEGDGTSGAMSGEEETCQSPVRSPLKDDSSDTVAVQKSECVTSGEEETRPSPVRSPLKDDSSDVVAVQKSECGTSQQDGRVQEEDNSMEDNEVADSFLTVDITGDTSIEEGDGTSGEPEMPEGVELDTDGEEVEFLEERVGPPAAVDVVPSYDTNLTGVLGDVEYSMVTGKKINDARPKKTCFNCLADHNMSECPEPHDHAKIAVNRKKHMSNRVSNVRYHEDCLNKYGQFQPGRISDSLRHALGLRPHQLPLYVYRMRVLGYPPGWLKDAEVHQADVKMYDASGKSVSHPAEEEGEAEPCTVKYKPEKLISFPGFNDPPPRGVQDECHRYNLPVMQPYHQRTEFLHFMNKNKAEVYKKKKLKDSELKSNETVSAAEMEVEEEAIDRSAEIIFNPPLPEDSPPPPPPPLSPPAETVKDVEEGEISEDSQNSMSGLEAKKERILKELEEVGVSSQDGNEDLNKQPSNNKNQEDSEDSQLSPASNTDPSQSENSCSSDTLKRKKKKQHHRSHSKGFKFGTVIPQSSTSYTKLPEAEKWRVDVSEHIVFENLPDALGTWDKMKGVMGVVKKRMTEIHADEDE